MMKHEFEALAGYEVSADDYRNIIEPMYMATNLDKAEFVKCIDKKRFALKPISKIVKEMKKTAEEIEERCTVDGAYDLKDHLQDLAKEYIKRRGLENIAGFSVTDRMKWSCYYPVSIEFYDFKEYKTIEKINLF